MWTLTPTESAKADARVGVTAGRTGYVMAGAVAGAAVAVVVVVVVFSAVVVVVVLRAFASTARRLARMLRWRAAHVTTGRCLALTRPSRRRSVRRAPWRPVTRETCWPATRHEVQWRRARGTPVIATRST